MIFKVQDIINRSISNLYTISQIDFRYLSDTERDSIISEYGKIIDGVYTNICSEFDESLLEISKECTNQLNKLKSTLDKVRVYYKSRPSEKRFKRLKYELNLKDIKRYYNKKIMEVTLDKLNQWSLMEIYLENTRDIINDFDESILKVNYDIYNMDDVVNEISKHPMLVDDEFRTGDEIPAYILKIYFDYSSIIKWCNSIVELTYQKLTEYKNYIERDILSKSRNINQVCSKEICVSSVSAILFFSQVYILTESVLRFYMTIVLLSVKQLNDYIEIFIT